MSKVHYFNNIAWITGASSGLGRDLAIQLSQKEWQLILSGRNRSALEHTKTSCLNPSLHRILPFDASDINAVNTALKSIDVTPSLVILNAGVSQRAVSYELDTNVLYYSTQVNYLTPVHIASSLLPDMMQQSGGLIVAVSSVASVAGVPGRSAYASAKAALNIYMSTIATECYASGVRVTIVYPGFIQTPISVHALRKDGTQHQKMDITHTDAMDSTHAASVIIKKLGNPAIWIGLTPRLKLLRFFARYSPSFLYSRMRKMV